MAYFFGPPCMLMWNIQWLIQKLWKGEDNVSTPSYFIANAHNEFIRVLYGKNGSLIKILRTIGIGEDAPAPWPGHWKHRPTFCLEKERSSRPCVWERAATTRTLRFRGTTPFADDQSRRWTGSRRPTRPTPDADSQRTSFVPRVPTQCRERRTLRRRLWPDQGWPVSREVLPTLAAVLQRRIRVTND